MEILPAEHRSVLPRWLGARFVQLILLSAVLVFTFILGGASAKSGFFGTVVRPIVNTGADLPSRYWRASRAKPPRIVIDMKFVHFQRLEFQRARALRESVLMVDSNDTVPATITINGESVRVKMRLKGDAADHIDGEKWSFRIQADGDSTIRGIKQFSLHHPRARNYMHEWLLHRMLGREDVLSLRYEFVEVTLNGKDLGVYALEEHFEKRLLEHQQRREGPIVRFNEELMWREISQQAAPFGTGTTTGFGAYTSSHVDGFGVARLKKNPAQWEQYQYAVALLESFRTGQRKASEVFDVDRLAAYFAFLDLAGGSHGALWHNARFYFNPVTARLEPIGFDMDAGKELMALIGFGYFQTREAAGVGTSEELYWRRIFDDHKFVAAYVKRLDQFSKPEYLEAILAAEDADVQSAMAILWREFPDYSFDTTVLIRNQKLIAALLDPYEALHGYLRSSDSTQLTVDVTNLQSLPVEVLGIEMAGGQVVAPDGAVVLDGKPYKELAAVRTVTFTSSVALQPQALAAGAPSLLRYRILGRTMERKTPLNPWPLFDSAAIERDLLRAPPSAESMPFVEVDHVRRIARILPGEHRVAKDLVFPEGYAIHCGPNTVLDLVEGALILSVSPISFVGTEEEPIVIRSSDGTGQGLVVLRAPGPSDLTYVHFEGLTNPNRPGWKLTGAITFYESAVSMRRSRSSRNQSEDAINLVRSPFLLEDVTFEQTTSDAFDADFSNGRIENATFFQCGNDCVDVSGSEVEIIGMKVNGAGDKALSAGEASRVHARGIDVQSAKSGLVAKDRSLLSAEDATLRDVQYAIAAFRKKAEFGPGMAIIHRYRISGATELLIERGSTVEIDGVQLPPNIENVGALLYPAESPSRAAP